MQTLQSFMASPARTAWIRHGNLNVYVRKNAHLVNKEILNCLDIANMLLVQGAPSRTGELKRLLESAELIVLERQLQALYIENVLNMDLPEFLLRVGFTEIKGYQDLGPSSFYKLVG